MREYKRPPDAREAPQNAFSFSGDTIHVQGVFDATAGRERYCEEKKGLRWLTGAKNRSFQKLFFKKFRF